MTTPHETFAITVRDAYAALLEARDSEQRAILIGREVLATMKDTASRKTGCCFEVVDDEGRRAIVSVEIRPALRQPREIAPTSGAAE